MCHVKRVKGIDDRREQKESEGSLSPVYDSFCPFLFELVVRIGMGRLFLATFRIIHSDSFCHPISLARPSP